MRSPLALLISLALLAAPAGAAATALTETGSTLLYPLMTTWVGAYEAAHPDVHIETAATGSGIGIAEAANGSVSFGASDAYPAGSGLLAIPLAISAQHVAYHVAGLNPSAHVRLSAAVIAAIYRGTVTRWNDPQIKALNRELAESLPATTIVPIRRSDASGDTFLFTEYLRIASEGAWTAGSGTRIDWPTVPGEQLAKQNRDVVQLLTDINGAIGYVGISYLEQSLRSGLGIAALRNRSGAFVLPERETVAATLDHLPASAGDEQISLIDLGGARSYPIVNVEYAIVRTRGYDPQTASALRAFLTWAIAPAGGNAPAMLDPVHFAALPARLRRQSGERIARIQ